MRANHSEQAWRSFALLFFIGAALSGSRSATGQQAAPQNTPLPTISVTTREVLVDVLVSDAHGLPVTGLTVADFKATGARGAADDTELDGASPDDGGRSRQTRQRSGATPNTFTNYVPIVNTNTSTVILLDALNTSINAQAYVRGELIKYLKNMQPGTPIAIFQMDTEMRLIQGFTSDQKVLLAAAESKRDSVSLNKPHYGNYYMYQQSHLGGLREGMQVLGRYLAGFPGRKNLIWFTGQVPLDLYGGGLGSPFPDGFYVSQDDVRGLTDELRVSRVAVYPVDSRGLMVNPAYSAEHGGKPGASSDMNFSRKQFYDHSNLDMIAEESGGKAFYNTNGLDKVIAQVVSEGSDYYTIAYATTNAKWDGRFQKIKIEADRQHVRLHYRPGYYASNSPEARAPLEATDATSQQPAGKGRLIEAHDGFDAALDLGSVPPTEIVFAAGMKPEDKTQKVQKNAPLPPGNHLHREWAAKPFRTFEISFHTDTNRIRLTQTPDGVRHGGFAVRRGDIHAGRRGCKFHHPGEGL